MANRNVNVAQTRQKSEEPEDVGGTADRNGEKSSTGKRGGATGALFIQEGNRAPVAKATHARYRGGTPLTRA